MADDDAKRVRAPADGPPRSSQRMRPFVAVVGVFVLIGVAWVAEINTALSQVQDESILLPAEPTAHTLLRTETPSPAPSLAPSTNQNDTPTGSKKKKCERLDHREPRFVNVENKNLCLSDGELITVIRELVFTAATIFETNNVTFFLESGTLLGSHREKGVIRHDKDADLGIDAAGLTYLQATAVAVPDAYHFSVWNSSLYPGSHCDDKLPVRLTHRDSALYADVFAFLNWTNATTGEDAVGPLPSTCFWNCVACPRVNGGRHFKVPRDWVYPLVDCPFEGRTLICPRQADKYLQHLYGRNYMTPSDH